MEWSSPSNQWHYSMGDKLIAGNYNFHTFHENTLYAFRSSASIGVAVVFCMISQNPLVTPPGDTSTWTPQITEGQNNVAKKGFHSADVLQGIVTVWRQSSLYKATNHTWLGALNNGSGMFSHLCCSWSVCQEAGDPITQGWAQCQVLLLQSLHKVWPSRWYIPTNTACGCPVEREVRKGCNFGQLVREGTKPTLFPVEDRKYLRTSSSTYSVNLLCQVLSFTLLFLGLQRTLTEHSNISNVYYF